MPTADKQMMPRTTNTATRATLSKRLTVSFVFMGIWYGVWGCVSIVLSIASTMAESGVMVSGVAVARRCSVSRAGDEQGGDDGD